MESMDEIRHTLELVGGHVLLHASAANRIPHLVQRTTRVNQKVGEFGVRPAAEAFRDVSTHRVDRVVGLLLCLEVPSKLRLRREPEDHGSQFVRKLPNPKL
jgi:hypothetical protein